MIPGALFALILNPLASDALGGEPGVGLLAGLGSLVVCAMSLAAGSLADRWKPQLVMLAGMTLYCVSTAGLCLLSFWTIPVFVLFGYAVIEAISVGLYIPPMLKTQAALVVPESRGSADILLNLFRFSSALIGFQVVARSSHPAAVLSVLTGLGLVGSFSAWLIAREIPIAPLQRSSKSWGLSGFIDNLQSQKRLRTTLIAEISLRFVLPTQLVALFAVDYAIGPLIVPLTTAGMAGVAAGRITLLLIGIQGDIPLRLRITLWSWIGLCAMGAVLLTDNWLLNQPILIALLVGLSSLCIAVLQGTLQAVIQQQCPDEIRGRLSGWLIAVKTGVEMMALAVTTSVISIWHSEAVLILLALFSILISISLKGFASVKPFGSNGMAMP